MSVVEGSVTRLAGRRDGGSPERSLRAQQRIARMKRSAQSGELGATPFPYSATQHTGYLLIFEYKGSRIITHRRQLEEKRDIPPGIGGIQSQGWQCLASQSCNLNIGNPCRYDE